MNRRTSHLSRGAAAALVSDPSFTLQSMKKLMQQNLPPPLWGGARRGAGRKRKSPRKNVPHTTRKTFHRGALHVTLRMRREVWNLRTHRCFRALRRAFARGCERFGFRLVHFSVQGNHIHLIVEAPDAIALGRAMRASRCGWRARSTR
jgi:putative transposase